MDKASPNTREGYLYGLVAYVWWGLVPIYFKSLAHVPPLEMLAHRIVWSVVVLAAMLSWAGRWGEVKRCLTSGTARWRLLATTVLIAVNWLTYIHAVTVGQVVQASLGYFILPLVSVSLGIVFLGERMKPAQWLATALAAAGVAVLVIGAGEVPWIALTLAFSFSLYGLLRKQIGVDGLIALAVETLLLFPLSLGYVLYGVWNGESAMGETANTDVLIFLSGVVTTVPLYCFAEAVRRLPLTTLSFLQYLSPGLALALAVAFYREDFGPEKQLCFALVCAALIVYSVAARSQPPPIEPAED